MPYRWFTESNIERTIGRHLLDAAAKRRDAPALRYFGKTVSYWDVWKYAVKTSFFIEEESGIARNDRVALFMPNVPQFVFAYYGTLMAGRVAVPINFASIADALKTKKATDILVTPEIIAQFMNSRPSLVFVADRFYPIFSQIPIDWPCRVVAVSPAEFLPPYLKPLYALKMLRQNGRIRFAPKHTEYFSDIIPNLPVYIFSRAYQSADRLAQLQYTGGTTGAPKGAMLTERNLVINMWQAREHFGDVLKDEEEVVLGALPFFHIYGLNMCMNMTLLALRGTIVLMPLFTPKDALRLIERERVSVLPGVERVYDKMLREEKLLAKTDLSSLKTCVSGAGSLRRSVAARLRRTMGAAIVEGYGMSEASPVVSATMPEDADRPAPDRGNLIGLPVPGTVVTIRDEDGNEAPTGEVGRIYVAGPQIMQGYFGNEEETNKVLQHGVLKTPDYGYKDADGRLYFTDRDMLKILGENVYPADIERVLVTHSAVAEVAVVGIPHPKTQETAVAVVVLKKGVPPPHEKEMLAYAKEHLLRIAVPSRIYFWDSLDEFKNVIGKIQKRLIRERVLEILESEQKRPS